MWWRLDERTRLLYSTGARPPPKEILCPAYGADTCQKKEGHIEGQFKMAHHCSICMHALGKARPHSLAKCPIKRNVYKAVDSQEGGGRRRRGGSHRNVLVRRMAWTSHLKKTSAWRGDLPNSGKSPCCAHPWPSLPPIPGCHVTYFWETAPWVRLSWDPGG